MAGGSKAPIPMGWEARVHTVYDSMGVAEKRVADYFRAVGFGILTQSIAEISEATGASEATIVRFCRRLDYGGLKDFKIALAMEQSTALPLEEHTLSWDDDMQAVRNKSFSDTIKALSDSVNLLDDKSLELAVDAMCQRSQLLAYGEGSAMAVLAFLRHQFLRLGVRVDVYADAVGQRLSAAMTDGDITAMAVSSSGEDAGTVAAARLAHQQGVKVIALTGRMDSSLARVSDILLITTGGPFLFGETDSLSCFSQMAAVNALYLGVALRMGEDAVEMLEGSWTEAMMGR